MNSTYKMAHQMVISTHQSSSPKGQKGSKNKNTVSPLQVDVVQSARPVLYKGSSTGNNHTLVDCDGSFVGSGEILQVEANLISSHHKQVSPSVRNKKCHNWSYITNIDECDMTAVRLDLSDVIARLETNTVDYPVG